mgnify:CR=1 FL=1
MLVKEHSSEKYSQRTYHNARTSQLTVAFAEDFNTAGERLTRKAAGEDKYVHFHLSESPLDVARKLYVVCKKRNIKKLNIAGNGIYTLKKKGWKQETINQWVYDVISLVHAHHGFDSIISGGQTGVDLAGAIAADACAVPHVEMTLPKGFLQRSIDNQEIIQTERDVLAQVQFYLPKIVLKKIEKS